MGRSDLTVEVLNLSPKVTLVELNIFFSYCGTVEEIQFHKNKDNSRMALVTFRQPYAFQTALLLNDAILAGQPIRIQPSEDMVIPPTTPDKQIDNTEKHEVGEFIPAVQAAMQAMASKGIELLNKTKHELEENYKLSEKGRMVVDQTKSTIRVVEQAAEHLGTAIKNNNSILTGTAWFSDAVDKTSKCVLALGTSRRDDSNSRKRK